MTLIGPTLTGLTLGTLTIPRNASRWQIGAYLALPALLANVPDLPFRGWGHDRYLVSPSCWPSRSGASDILTAAGMQMPMLTEILLRVV